MKFDYNYFTKSELVSFLNKYEDNFKYITKPYLIILEEKIEEVFKEIEKIHEHNDLLIKQLDLEESNKLQIHLQLMKNHDKWEKLNGQIDKLSKLAYGSD